MSALAILVITIGASSSMQLQMQAAASEHFRSVPQPQFSLHWIPDPASANRVAVEISGLSAPMLRRLQRANPDQTEWQRLLSVYVVPPGATAKGMPAMLGTYSVTENVIRFEPRFALEPGVTYQAILRPAHLPGAGKRQAAELTSEFTLPSRLKVATTEVSRIYPGTDLLPENLLKFYVHFSAPMSRGHIYDYIHLRDKAGREVELPFLEIDEELWNPEMTRLTLIIDPGRIKRGVLPLEEIGPALEQGKSYALVIDGEWMDAVGNPLKSGFQKVFTVGPPDRDPPDPARWQIETPESDTRAPLTVAFQEPMDQALAERIMQVKNEKGELLVGKVSLTDNERRWIFVPDNAWQRGAYDLVIPTTIEDLAGNNIGKPFDVDVFTGVEQRISTAMVKVPFTVR